MDRNESEKNQKYRQQFKKECFEYELNSHLWIQVTEDYVKNLEREENPLENIYFMNTKMKIKKKQGNIMFIPLKNLTILNLPCQFDVTHN